MCKDYSSRLDEWIIYNLKLGFSGIIIFNNDLDNSIETEKMKNICKKYKNKVFLVSFPYSPFECIDWNNIQKILLHIGVN